MYVEVGEEEDSFLTKIILKKYFRNEGRSCTNPSSLTFISPIWRNMAKTADFVSVYQVGNSKSLCFWKDHWCLQESISSQFKNLYQLTTDKGKTVEQLKVSGDYSSWNIQLRWNLRF